MFVIRRSDNGYYFHKKGKIIIFENPKEAELCLQNFYQYCMQRLLQESGPQGIFELQGIFSYLEIIEKDYQEETACGTIYCHEIV